MGFLAFGLFLLVMFVFFPVLLRSPSSAGGGFFFVGVTTARALGGYMSDWWRLDGKNIREARRCDC